VTAQPVVRLELRLAPTVQAPRIARSRVTERFAARLENDELRDAGLLTSELVTNAVVHGRGAIQLTASLNDECLRIEVVDQGEGFERTVRELAFGAVGGHRLNIVDALASRWGIHEGESHVWFELACRGRRREPVSRTSRPSGIDPGVCRRTELSGGIPTEFRKLGDDIGERPGGVDLVSARPTQPRFNLCHVAEHELALRGGLPVGVVRPHLDPAQENVNGGAQQDYSIEAVVEPALVRHRSADIDTRTVVIREELRHPLLPPDVSALGL